MRHVTASIGRLGKSPGALLLTQLPMLFCLLFNGSPGQAQTALSHEFEVKVLDNRQSAPVIAYADDHEEFLVVWTNIWSDAGGTHRDTYGRRVDKFGQPLSYAFTISVGAHDRSQPDVVYDWVNDRYLVVWAFDKNGDGSDWNIRGRFIPWSGPDPNQKEFIIYSFGSVDQNPSVEYSFTAPAPDSGSFLVVWESVGPPSEILGRQILGGGTFFPICPIASSPTEDRHKPALAYNFGTDEYLVVYERDNDIAGTIVEEHGFPVVTEFAIAGGSDTHTRPSVAAALNRYFVTWSTDDHVYDVNVLGRMVNRAGTVDFNTVEVATVSSGASLYSDVTYNFHENNFLVVLQQEYDTDVFAILGQTVNLDKSMPYGFAVRGTPPSEPLFCREPTAACGTIGCAVVWGHDRQGTTFADIHGRMVWHLFADGFEGASTDTWSSSTP